MARPDFPLNIDRRRLLTPAAATVTATGILPGVKLADAAAADVLQSSPLTRKAEPRNCCAATAGGFSKLHVETRFVGKQSCPFCRLQKSYAG
jgi:hypothetical protein